MSKKGGEILWHVVATEDTSVSNIRRGIVDIGVSSISTIPRLLLPY